MTSASLIVVQGKPIGKEIPLRPPKFLIGRGTECHLRPSSEMISRQHCLFTITDDELRVVDMGSTNGTILNGKKVETETTVRNGDLVEVGPLGFKVKIQVVAVPPSNVVAPVPVAPPVAVAKLGNHDAADADIEHWLLGDAAHPVPETPSSIYGGDTQMDTAVVRAQDTDTNADVPTSGSGVVAAEVPAGEPAADDGAKLTNKGPKQVIEKTREDTSRAAADILKKMLERRPNR